MAMCFPTLTDRGKSPEAVPGYRVPEEAASIASLAEEKESRCLEHWAESSCDRSNPPEHTAGSRPLRLRERREAAPSECLTSIPAPDRALVP